MWKSALAAVAAMALTSASLAADSNVPDSAALRASDPAVSIQRLYEECSGTDLHKQMFCLGYIRATIDNMMIIGASGGEAAQSFGICPKGPITTGAGKQVFTNWAQKHPEAWGLIQYIGVAFALKETWPCT